MEDLMSSAYLHAIRPRAINRPNPWTRSTDTPLNGIIFRLRTGCQWSRLPEALGDDSTVHRHFQRWCQAGIFDRLWAVLVEACDGLHGVEWQWQAADTTMGTARMGGDLVGRNPTDRGKKG
jgi:putative transposase